MLRQLEPRILNKDLYKSFSLFDLVLKKFDLSYQAIVVFTSFTKVRHFKSIGIKNLEYRKTLKTFISVLLNEKKVTNTFSYLASILKVSKKNLVLI